MPIVVPCRDCEMRKLHCHSACEKYKEYRKEIETRNAEMREKVEAYNFAHAVKKEVWRRFYKRRSGDDR